MDNEKKSWFIKWLQEVMAHEENESRRDAYLQCISLIPHERFPFKIAEQQSEARAKVVGHYADQLEGEPRKWINRTLVFTRVLNKWNAA